MLPIYTAAHLLALSDGWFIHPNGATKGPSITLLRQYVKPQATHRRTLFVARVAHRQKVTQLQRQHQTPNTAGRLYPRQFYRVAHYTYDVCAMSWNDYAIIVLAPHSTKTDAINALQTMLS